MALEIRVLVVEDDPETRLLTEALLSGRKGVCLCALAKDGLEGLELSGLVCSTSLSLIHISEPTRH